MNPTAPPALGEYIAIRLAAITVNEILSFDLYQENCGSMILYRNRNYPISAEDIRALLDSGSHELFVPADQSDQLYDYQRQRLPQLLEDDTIPLEDKLQILSETSVNMLGRVLDNPMSAKEIKGVADQCHNHVRSAFAGGEAQKSMVLNRALAPYPIAHAISVANLSLILGLHCSTKDAASLHELGVGALLHEIGKTLLDRDYYYQPESKKSKTDPRMRQYPLVGRDMLERSNFVPKEALRAVAEHQERLDGSGYPFSLKESQISKMGKIVAICDHYDEAINGHDGTSQATPFVALSEMKKADQKFDQRILTRFIQMLAGYSSN